MNAAKSAAWWNTLRWVDVFCFIYFFGVRCYLLLFLITMVLLAALLAIFAVVVYILNICAHIIGAHVRQLLQQGDGSARKEEPR